MLSRMKSRITFTNVVASIALFVSLSTGAVYAANEWTGAHIVDGSLSGADLAMNTVGGQRIEDDTMTADDLAANSVASSEILDGSITKADLGSAPSAPTRSPRTYGVCVSAANTVVLAVCDLTAGTSPVITDLPVRIVTFG